jgi:hypothetical protein
MKRHLLIICAVCGLLPLLPSQAKADDDCGYPGWVEYHTGYWNDWAWRRHQWREHWRHEHEAREYYWHRWHDDD